ncbi:MAG: hypothetical protein AAF907_17890, partial [Planctomycetota bacterium]
MERSPRPRPAVTLALCAAAFLIGLVVVIAAAPQPTAAVRGTLHSAEVVIRAPRDGRIVEWIEEPGAGVKPGVAIVELQDASRLSRLADADAEVTRASAALSAAKKRAALDLAWRTAEVRRDLHAVRTETAELLRDQFDAALTADAADRAGTGTRIPARTVSVTSPSPTAAIAAASTANAAQVLRARLTLCEVRERELLDL